MHDHEKRFYGVGTVGEKGQIVVPAQAREAMKIKTGDKFVFFGVGPMLHMIEAEKMNHFLEKITSFSSKIEQFKKSVQDNIKEAK